MAEQEEVVHDEQEEVVHDEQEEVVRIEESSEFAPVKRDQILGIDHILDELDGYIKFLKNFEDAERLNASISPGILFYGEPGTGKTLCARYVATQSEACFVDVQEFINSKSKDGVDTKTIEKLFLAAREYAEETKKPVILFWDEIEAYVIGEDVVSQLKTELSGSKGRLKGVFLIAVTNKVGEIDETLLRTGRIGKKFHFSAPNRKAKLELLKYYTRQHNASPDIDFASISHIIKASAVPTDIEEAVNNAWNTACMDAITNDKKAPELSQDMLVQGLLEELMGPPDNTVLSKDKLREIDIYLIGRALVARTLNHPVQVVALPRVGYVQPEFVQEFDDNPFISLEDIKKRVITHCAGRKAQKILDIGPNMLGEQDFDYATAHAEQVIERLNSTMEGISPYGLTNSRSQIGMPPAVGINSKKLHETIGSIEKLVTDSEEKAELILKHYGEKTILELVELLSDRGYIVQADVDKHIVPYEEIKKEDAPPSPSPDEHSPGGQYL